jgi:hypothetical protein
VVVVVAWTVVVVVSTTVVVVSTAVVVGAIEVSTTAVLATVVGGAVVSAGLPHCTTMSRAATAAEARPSI